MQLKKKIEMIADVKIYNKFVWKSRKFEKNNCRKNKMINKCFYNFVNLFFFFDDADDFLFDFFFFFFLFFNFLVLFENSTIFLNFHTIFELLFQMKMFDATIFESMIVFVTLFVITFEYHLNNHWFLDDVFDDFDN